MKNKNVLFDSEVEGKIVILRSVPVIADADVADLYEIDTRRVNEAVRNNKEKFPADYMFELTMSELRDLRSKISTTKVSLKSRSATKVFTEKGLYMLATILKSNRATLVTFAIIETFAKVRELQRELVILHKEENQNQELQVSKVQHFGDVLSDIVMPLHLSSILSLVKSSIQ